MVIFNSYITLPHGIKTGDNDNASLQDNGIKCGKPNNETIPQSSPS